MFGEQRIINNIRELKRKKILEELNKRTQDPNDTLYGLNSADIDRIYNEYVNTEDFKFLDPDTWKSVFDKEALEEDIREYANWKDLVGDMPEMVDYDQVAAQANAEIDQENAQLMALYDEMLGRNTDLYRTQLEANNNMYNDYVGQMLSNQAQSQNILQGSVRSEMDRSRRNAIHRGASAAMQLVANVNAQLGLQNQSAMNALQTSNNLAQALLNQRQAAMQLRGDYTGSLNEYTANKANTVAGNAERKAGFRGSNYNEQDMMYNQKLNQWEDKLSGYAGSSVFSDVHRNASRRANQSSKYGL